MTRAFSAMVVTVACLGLIGLSAAAALPEANLCFFGGYPNPNGYAYVSYLQPRFKHVKINPVVVGNQNRSLSYEARRDWLRAELPAKKCIAVVDGGGNSANYTLYRALRAEPGMPLWVESQWGKNYYDTESEPDKYPALRMWARPQDQPVTAINTALALGWKEVVIVSTNKTGDNETLALVSAQAKHEGLRVHNTFVEGDEGMETTAKLIDKIAEVSPTRAVLTATAQTSVIQALVDSPRGLVPIIPLTLKSNFIISASLGVLAPEEIVLTAPFRWQDHWKNFTNTTELWEKWQVTQPPANDVQFFRSTSSVYMDDVEVVAVAMAVIDQYFKNESSTAASASVSTASTSAVTTSTSMAPLPTPQELLKVSRGLEVELFTRFIRVANNSAGTFAPPRTLEVSMTQPPKNGLTYTWKVIANVSIDGTTWQTNDILQWPAVGKIRGIINPLFPGPIVPETKTNWPLIGVLSALALLLVIGGIAAAVHFFLQWASLRHCPKDADEPFTAFFVSTHNEDEIRDLYGYKAHEIFNTVRVIVANAASDHKCYVARRLEAHYLLVAKDPEDAVKCAAEVVTNVAKITAKAPPPMKKKVRHTNNSTPSSMSIRSLRSASYTATVRSDGTKHSGSRSEMSGRSSKSRQIATGLARSQSRRVGIVPQVAIGMARAIGRIEKEDSGYVYAGEPVDVAAAISDFAIQNQVLATQEVTQGLPQEGVLVTRFEEYCEREFGRGRCAENYELLEYVADGCPRADPELAEAARNGKSEGTGGVGALSAALQASTGGLVTRSVAVAAIHIPELSSRTTDVAAINRVQDVFDVVAAVADDFKATFAAFHDGWCLVTVNGTGGVAQAPMRATSVAVSVVDCLRDGGFAATAGVAAGPMIAGGIASEAAAARHITAGGNTERARLLALGADVNSGAVLVTEMVKREAESSFEFAAADFVATRAPPSKDAKPTAPTKNAGHSNSANITGDDLISHLTPKHKASKMSTAGIEEVAALSVTSATSPANVHHHHQASAKSTPPLVSLDVVTTSTPSMPFATLDEGGMGALSTMKAAAAPSHRTMKVFAVVAASSAGEVEDEWMYQLAAAGTGPCVRINAAFELISEGAIAEAQTKFTEAAAAMALVDTPAMAAIDNDGEAAMKAAVARGEEICSVLATAAKQGADHVQALTALALQRTHVYAYQCV